MEEVSKSNGGVNKAPQQMSASLKERLKRCGRYYSSPTTTKTPKHTGFLPTPDSTSAPSSLNSNCNTPTTNRHIYETPPYANVTPSSSEDQRDSCFDDSTSLSCTPVLKARDMQGSQPRVKRLRLSSRARFNVDLSSDVTQEEQNRNPPKPETSTRTLNPHLLEEDNTLRITACGDGKYLNSKSPEKDLLTVASSVSSLSRDGVPHLGNNVPQSGDNGLDGKCQDAHSPEVNPENLCGELVARKLELQKQLKEKQECLRKLRMVKLYRSKNDLASLVELITKWRGVSQQVLVDLHQKLPEPKPTLSGFLQHLNIDQTFLRFNPEEETFY